ncbi:MAG: cysteine desulfurase [Polyangiaceae bacterium]|nr:cysteine desulfurase [Polyangiaceae bacterium]
MTARAYLDWNATTPLHPEVVEAVLQASGEAWGNPASVHATGRRARQRVERVREQLAEWLRASPRDVLFTAGGTEANNLALRAAPALVTSRLEHPSVVRAAEAVAAEGRPVEWLPVRPDGTVELAELPDRLARLPRGTVVALMAANHETGVLQPVALALQITRAHGARLHVDAVQAAGKVELAPALGADSLALTAHKLRGPKGVGALIWRGDPAGIARLVVGGSQERGLRPGTVDAVAIAGLGKAVELAITGPARYAATSALRDELEAALTPPGQLNGSAPRLPHVSNLSFPGLRSDEAIAALDLLGVEVSSGSACSVGSQETSAVVRAMLGEERAATAIRFSLGDVTGREEVGLAISALRQVLARRSSSASRSG